MYDIEKEIPAILDNDICFLKEEVLKKVLKGAIEEIVSMFDLNVTIEKMEELGLNATDESKNIIVWSNKEAPTAHSKIEVKLLTQIETDVDSPTWNGPKMTLKEMGLYHTCVFGIFKSTSKLNQNPPPMLLHSWKSQAAKNGFVLKFKKEKSNNQMNINLVKLDNSEVKCLLYISLYALENPSTILITTTGHAADWRGGRLGIYEKAGAYNDCPIYIQLHNIGEGEPYVLFKHNSGFWCIGDSIGNNTFFLKNDSNTSNIPLMKWKYEKIMEREKRNKDFEDEEWMIDPELRIKRAITVPCGDIHISSNTKDVESEKPECLGLYKATNLFSRGRMIFKHVSNQRYLMVDHWKVFWCIKDSPDSLWAPHIHSNCAPSLCPADQRANISFRFKRTQWHYSKGFSYCPADFNILCSVHSK